MPRTTAAPADVSALIDPKEVLDLILEALPLPGLSGKEGRMAEFVTKTLRKAGVPAGAIRHDDANKRSPLGGEIGNLVCALPGTIKAPRRLLMAHMDTVPLCQGTRPVVKGEYVVSGNPATGLGADNRSGVCAVLSAVRAIFKHKLPHPPLTLFFPVQEEVGLFGARFADLKLLEKPKLCFNWDGNTPESVIVGATGAYHIKIGIEGLASHAGVAPEKGCSAIAIAGLALARLQENGWHGQIKKGRRTGTSNFGVISGGNAVNVVAPSVSFEAGARSQDPKFRKMIVNMYEVAFRRAAKSVKSSMGVRGKITFASDLRYESFKLSEDEPTVVAAKSAIEGMGLSPIVKVSNGGLDANWLSARGLPTVTLGAGQQEVHTVAERLHIESFVKGCRIALKLATGT